MFKGEKRRLVVFVRLIYRGKERMGRLIHRGKKEGERRGETWGERSREKERERTEIKEIDRQSCLEHWLLAYVCD